MALVAKPTHMSRGRREIAAVLVTCILVAAACGGGEDDSEPVHDSVGGQEPMGPPIMIATIGEFSAGIALPEIPEAVEATVAAVNDEGGVDGRRLEALICDTRNDPNTAAACGREAIDAGAVAVAGSWSLLTAEWFPLMEANDVPVVGGTPTSAADFTSPVSFPAWGGFVVDSAALLRSLAEAGARSVAIVRPDFAAGAAIQQFGRMVLGPFGATVAADVPVPPGAVDMSPYVAAALTSGADGVVVGLPGLQATNAVIGLREGDPAVTIGLAATEVDDVVAALGSAAAGILRSAEVVPVDLGTPLTDGFVETMAASGVEELGGARERTYAAVVMVADLLRASGATTGGELLEVLETAVSADPAGLAPPVDFTRGGVAGLPRIFQGCVLLVRLDAEGEPQPTTGGFTQAVSGEDCAGPVGL